MDRSQLRDHRRRHPRIRRQQLPDPRRHRVHDLARPRPLTSRAVTGHSRPHRIPRHAHHPGDLPDRQALRPVKPADLSPVLHAQHPSSPVTRLVPGSIGEGQFSVPTQGQFSLAADTPIASGWTADWLVLGAAISRSTSSERCRCGTKGPAPELLTATATSPAAPIIGYMNSRPQPERWPEGKEQAMPGIVVGIDGSPNSERALDWAMRQAAAVHAPLMVITVHEVPKSYWGGIPVIGPADRPLLEKLRQAAEEMTQKAASRLGDAGPASVTVHAFNGFVARELVDASQGADLVVVGARSGSGLARLLLGSVSNEVVQHSACPVVIVPHKKRTGPAAGIASPGAWRHWSPTGPIGRADGLQACFQAAGDAGRQLGGVVSVPVGAS